MASGQQPARVTSPQLEGSKRKTGCSLSVVEKRSVRPTVPAGFQMDYNDIAKERLGDV